MADFRPVIVTVVTRNYLHFARALAASLREVDPALRLRAYVIDRPAPAECDWRREQMQIVFADRLGIPDWPRFAFQYSGFELSCALKPFILEHALAQEPGRRVLYFDSDIQLYGPVTDLVRRLDEHSILLTPHLTSPLPDDGRTPQDHGLVMAGTYNAGFLGLRHSPPVVEFLRWWRQKMRSDCVTDVASHLFVDQVWLNLVPGLFDGVCVERSPEYNVAYWNLTERSMERTAGGRPLVNGRPVVFFHFSGFDPDRPELLSVYQDRLHLADLPIVFELTHEYARRLRSCGQSRCTAWGYAYDCLSDGTPIQPAWREAVRTGHPALAGIEDPFNVKATPDLLQRFQEAEAAARASRLDWRIADWIEADRMRLVEAERQRLAEAERRRHSLRGWLQRLGTNLRRAS